MFSRTRARRRAHRHLVSSLVSLFRAESDLGAERLRRIVPDPANARAAVAAAQEAYREVVRDDPDPYRTWAPLNLARYLQDFDAGEAAAVYRTVMARSARPAAELAAVCLGELLRGSGDLDGAAAVLDEVARQATDPALRSRAFFRLGAVRQAQLRLPEAQEAYAQAAEAGGEPHAWMGLANQVSVLAQLGETEAARACLERLAGHRDPSAAEAVAALAALLDEPDVEVVVARVVRQLIGVPCWYQTREILHRNAGVLPRLTQAFVEMAEHVEEATRFVDLLRRCERLGVDEALAAFVDLGADEVPVELRLLLLQVVEATEEVIDKGGALLDDLRDGCVALLRSNDWEGLPVAAAFEGRLIASDALLVLESCEAGPGLEDEADRLLRPLPELAVLAGRDPEQAEAALRALAEVRRTNLAVSWLEEFVAAVPRGTAGEVLDRHPELLQDWLIDDFGERLGHEEPGTDELLDRLRVGVDVLRRCRQHGAEPVLASLYAANERIADLIAKGEMTPADLDRLAAGPPPAVAEAAADEDPAERAERGRLGADALELLLRATNAGERRKVIEAHADVLLREDADAALTAMVEHEQGPLAEVALLARSILRGYQVFGPEPDAERQVMIALLVPEDPAVETTRALLRDHPGLLLPFADEVLDEIQRSVDDEVIADRVATRRRMLRRCAVIGVDAAVAEAWDDGKLLDAHSHELLSRAMLLTTQMDRTDPSTLDLATRAWTEAQTLPMFTAGRIAAVPVPRPIARALAAFHGMRYGTTGDAEDGDRAVEGLRDLARRTAEDDADYAHTMHLLGVALCDRYDVEGRVDDLRDAIAALEKADRADPRDGGWDNLAEALVRRHKRFGDAADLDRAIALVESRLDGQRPGTGENHRGWSALSLALDARFYQTGRLDDLDRATAIGEELVAAPVDAPIHAIFLANHGLRLLDQYNYRHDVAGLKRAVDLLRQAIGTPGTRRADQARWRSTLGLALGALAEVTGELPDLMESIAVHEQAVADTPRHTPEYANRCNNLGAGLIALYNRTRRTRDLNAAIAVLEDAVRATAADAPGYGWRAGNLAAALAARRGGHRELSARGRAGRLFRIGLEANLDVRPEVALRMATAWGERAADARDWDTAAEAYQAGVQAVQRLTETQILREDYAVWLQAAGELFVEAAGALARAGRPADAALALEQGRALVLSETLERDRAAVDSLTDAGLEPLRDRFTEAVARLRGLQTGGLGDDSGLRESALRAAHTRLRTIITEVRAQPGYENFLQPPAFTDITRAATTPLCYLTAARDGGWAVLVRGAQTRAIPLPRLTGAALDDQVRRYLDAYADRARTASARERWLEALDTVTRWLWDAVMATVVDSAGGADEVVLVASGRLGFLPLHAAWRPDDNMPSGRRYAIDDLLITYAPNARVLNAARHTADRVSAGAVLVVGAPEGTGADHLPHAATEAAEVHAIFGAGSSLTGADATPERVLAEMRAHDAVHFSCHGVGEPAEPLNSALTLAGGRRLTLRDLLNEPLVPRRLAVLSACETAVVGATLPDEVTGLPGGLLQTGVAGVVASLWAVPDRATMLLVRRLYEGWRREGLAPAAALRQAQLWLRDAGNGELHQRFPDLTTPRSERAYRIWAAARPHSHPYHWASFAHVGA